MKKILLLGLSLFLVSAVAFAQGRKVTGIVSSGEDGEPIPGATVLVKGTSVGAATDIDGKYSLTIPENGTVLVFSFIGMSTQELPVGGRTVIDVVLEFDAAELSEVVVTAMGIERNKNELAYSAQEVKGDQVSRSRSADFVATLSGKVAGLDIRSNNTMGGSTNVVIPLFPETTRLCL